MTKTEIIKLFVAVIIFAVVIAVVAVLGRIDTAQTIQLIITFVLVLVTVTYVKRTAEIASATREQAKAAKEQAAASVRMAEEMREQRRPIVVPQVARAQGVPYKLAPEDVSNNITSDYFEIYNVGNGPAIDLEALLLKSNKKKVPVKYTKTFLRHGNKEPFLFPRDDLLLHRLEEYSGQTCYLLCQYRSVLSPGEKQIWDETRLPFIPIKSQDRITIMPYE